MGYDTLSEPQSRLTGAASALCDARLAEGRFTVSLHEVVQETGLSAIAAQRQFERLRPAVVRVSPRQAFYLLVPPEHRSFGAPPPEWWLDDYFRWLQKPYYLALQSAASHFGSNPQASQMTQVITDHPRRPIHLGRVQLRFFVKSAIENSSTQQLPGAVAPLLLSTPESTAFDLVRYASSIGGIERAAETIRPLLPLLRPRELKRVLTAENEVPVAQRLGFIFDAFRSTALARTVRDYLPPTFQPVLLSPSVAIPLNVPLNQRWQVLINSTEFRK